MADKKKRRARKPKKQNIIDKTVGGLRGAGKSVKDTVAGSKEVGKVTGAVKAGAAKVADTSVGKKVSKGVQNLRGTTKADVKAAATGATNKVKGAVDTGASKVKAATGGAAGRANDRVRARNAGPQQPPSPRPAKPLAAGATVGTQEGISRKRAEERFNNKQAKADAPKQRSMTNRGLRAGGRQVRRFGGPAAVAAGADKGIEALQDKFIAGKDDVSGGLMDDATGFISDLPETLGQFGRDVINDPVNTGLNVGAGFLDTVANAGITGGTGIAAAALPGDTAQNLEKFRGLNSGMRDPFRQFIDRVRGDDQPAPPPPQQPAGPAAEDAAAQAPGAAGQPQPRKGLGAARSNREFLADEAGKFRSGFDVLEDSGTRATGGIGDLAAYNAATRIAKRENTTKKEARNINVSEAKARSSIEGQNVMNTLRGARTNAANARAGFAGQERLDTVGKEAVSILDNLTALQGDTNMFGSQSSENAAKIKNIQDVAFNQALTGGFDPSIAQSVVAGEITAKQIAPLMDRGVLQGVIDAFSSSDFDVGDIMNDNGELAINRETVDRMAMGGDDNTVFMSVPRENGQDEFIPLFPLDEMEDPNTRAFFTKMLSSGSGGQSLSNAQR